MTTTKIEWTESTWNPVTGCTKISDGCKNCYAEVMARRLKAMGQQKYKNGFKLTLHPETLNEPYTWKKPRMIFINSMSDLFHKDVPVDFIQKIFNAL
jgi:protein gp37